MIGGEEFLRQPGVDEFSVEGEFQVVLKQVRFKLLLVARFAEEDRVVDLFQFRTAVEQPCRNPQGPAVGVGEAEAASVGDEAEQPCGRRAPGELPAGRKGDFRREQARRRRFRVDQVAARFDRVPAVVIHIEQRKGLQKFPVEVVASRDAERTCTVEHQHEIAGGGLFPAQRQERRIPFGHPEIALRQRRRKKRVSLFARIAQKLLHAEGGTDRIAIRFHMGEDQNPFRRREFRRRVAGSAELMHRGWNPLR